MQGFRCPLACRCWPRPGSFSEEEVALLGVLTVWIGKVLRGYVPDPEVVIGRMHTLAAHTSPDRAGYVLSTPLALSQQVGTSVLHLCLRRFSGGFVSLAPVTDTLLTYGVCLETGATVYWHRRRPWSPHVTPRLHCGRVEVYTVSPLEHLLKDHGDHALVARLLVAGAYPCCHSRHAKDAWCRWHLDCARPRRRWLSLTLVQL